ncbi:HEAT repeat-containing protein 6-like [Clavelina lepadiformis]|uniref:HEAT repeat-containing protein 6-like n=1 Tax=Clavelina lepadiformis TaxID=159417 RepID=UPI00404173B3
MDTWLPDDIFKELYMELIHIPPKHCDKPKLLGVLTKLNQLNYKERLPFITRWTCTDMLLHLIGILKEFGQEEIFLIHLCQLIVNVAAKQKIVICSMSVSVILHGLREVWLQVLANYNGIPNDKCTHVLGAISTVTFGNGAYIIPELLEWLIGRDGRSGSISGLLQAPISLELKKVCLQCLSGLCLTSESREKLTEDHMHICLQLFIDALHSIPSIKDVAHYRVVFASHKGLQHILDGSNGIHVHEIGSFLAILKKHLVFGLPAQSKELPSILQPLPVPHTLQPNAKVSQVEPVSHQSSKKKKKRRTRKPNAKNRTDSDTSQPSPIKNMQDLLSENVKSLNLLTPKSLQKFPVNRGPSFDGANSDSDVLKMLGASSESDYSDTEGGQLSAMTSFAHKIRQMAIGSLLLIVRKTNKLIMLGYWNSFIPGTSSPNDVSLLSCIIHDPGPKARVAALMVVCAMLEGSRSFLGLATQETVSTSFISFSAMLASSVHDIHDVLLKAISRERSALVQVHILKALSSLAANAPYTKLNKGLVSGIISEVRKIMFSSHDVDCRVGALNVLISILSSDPALLEVACSITETEIPASSSTEHHNGKCLAKPLSALNLKSQSWLITDCMGLCLQASDTADTPLPLRIAALQLLTTTSRQYFVVIKPYLKELTTVIHYCMTTDNTTVQLHVFKLLEEIGRSLLKHQQNEEFVSDSLALWEELLSGPIQVATQEDIYFVNRSHICDFLSTIGPIVFEKLPQKLQLFAQTLLMGLTSDENYLVRSASIRSLAVFIMFPVLRRDICFVEDVAGCIIKLMKDSVKSVQSNAAWSFGNFTDAIIINVETDTDSFSLKEIGNSLLMELFDIAIHTFDTDSKDKVRFNMMRVLGNMLRLFNEYHVHNERFCTKIFQAKSLIIKAMLKDSLMKVRWNACLACGNMLGNRKLPVGKPEWTDDVVDALCSTVASSKNYKVKIKATVALGCPEKRDSYGKKFSSVYMCIVNTLLSSDDEAVDFGEYKFKDKLQEEIIYTLLHLTKLIVVDDMPSIISSVQDKVTINLIQFQLAKWYKTIKKPNEESRKEPESYAALGQYTSDQKLEFFNNACSHWKQVIRTYFNTGNEKEPSFDIHLASVISEIFLIPSSE